MANIIVFTNSNGSVVTRSLAPDLIERLGEEAALAQEAARATLPEFIRRRSGAAVEVPPKAADAPVVVDERDLPPQASRARWRIDRSGDRPRVAVDPPDPPT